MNRIKVFGFEGCPYCKEIMDLFKENNVSFDYLDVSLEKHKIMFENIVKIAKTDSVPILIVDKTILSPEITFFSIRQAYELTMGIISKN